jgi:hypothetical protein
VSGKDLVQQLRDGAMPAPKPPRDSDSSIGGLIFTAICTFVIGGSAVFGVLFYLQLQTPTVSALEPTFADAEGTLVAATGTETDPAGSPISPFVNVDLTARTWTAEDEANCQALGEQAGIDEDAAVDQEMMEQGLIMPASSGGLAERAAYLMCFMTTKPARFCDDGPRLELATMFDEHAVRIDAASALLSMSVASMNSPMLAIAGGGREQMGVSIVTDGITRTAERMKAEHRKIVMTFREMIKAGLLGPGDFDLFLGYGIRPGIEAMIGDAKLVDPICS